MLIKLLLWLNISLFYVHELDAVHRREWRMMPLFGRLDDETGTIIFTAAHLPLFAAVFWLMEYSFDFLFWFVSTFGLFHLLLHIIAAKHRENRMHNSFSRWIIILIFTVSSCSILLYCMN